MRFLNEDHALNFQNMILKDNTHPMDQERFALFYILGSNEDLFLKRSHIYDFKDHSIIAEILTEPTVDLCSSQKSLVRLAFNLYNGYEDSHTNPRDILKNLDPDNCFVAMQAMQLSFGRLINHQNIDQGGEEFEVVLEF